MASHASSSTVSVAPLGRPELSFKPFLPASVLILLTLALILGALRSYSISTRPLPAPRRLLLWMLRAGSALVVILCLTRPILVQATSLQEKGLCFISIDASSSMNLRDAPARRSRWEFAGRLFAQHQNELAQLQEKFDVRRFRFSERVSETQSLPGEEAKEKLARPEGRATNLAALLDQHLKEGKGLPCAGALVISDGRHNTLQDPLPIAHALRQAQIPLFIVGTGQEATPEDYSEVQIRVLEVPERGFVGSKLLFNLEISSTLPKPLHVPLEIQVNNEVIHKKDIRLSGRSEEPLRIEIPYTPKVLGVHRVVASIPPLKHEPNTNNNRRTAYFRVYQTKLGVWYVEGAIRKEFGAIRSALETAPNVNMQALNAFVRKRAPEYDLLPQTEKGWSNLKLVILGDLPRVRFSASQLTRLATFVEEGGALLMIGGIENFGPGGWGHSPLAPVFPVVMDRQDKDITGRLALSVTEEGQAMSLTRLADDPVLSTSIWKRLPPLPGINSVKEVKPAAKVLLKAGEAPLLVVHDYAKGRAAVFTGDMTWQWILKAGEDSAHKRFWRNLATWLTKSEYRDAQQAVFVESERLQYLLGDEVLLTAHVQATKSNALEMNRVKVIATLERENGSKTSWQMGSGAGEWHKRFTPEEPGSYTFHAEARDPSGKSIGSDAVSFQVDVLDVENDNPKANLRLLQRLAALSGGTYFDAEHAPEAFQHLLKRPAGFSKTVRTISPIWNHWIFFVLFVLLLSTEWGLRKRWGLV